MASTVCSEDRSRHAERALIVLGNFAHMGGGERQAFHLIRHLREKHDAAVSVLGWREEGPLVQVLRDLGCSVHSFPYREKARGLAKVFKLLGLAWFIRREIQPDIVLPFVSIHSKPVCQIWRLTGARYCWWNQQDEGRGLYGTKNERRALLNASSITSNSVAGAEFLINTYAIPEERIVVYNNGTPVPDPAKLEPVWRERLGIAPEVPLVTMLANVTPYKDHATLFRAWRLVLDQLSSPPPLLALAGHVKDRRHVQELKVLGFDLGIGSSVRFLGAIEDTDELIVESDLVVHSSTTEGCPNAVCEAMALAKPVVGTDIPGMRQALGDPPPTDCLAPPGDAARLAALMLGVLKNGEEAARFGQVNRDRIAKHFSIDGMCDHLLGLVSST